MKSYAMSIKRVIGMGIASRPGSCYSCPKIHNSDITLDIFTFALLWNIFRPVTCHYWVFQGWGAQYMAFLWSWSMNNYIWVTPQEALRPKNSIMAGVDQGVVWCRPHLYMHLEDCQTCPILSWSFSRWLDPMDGLPLLMVHEQLHVSHPLGSSQLQNCHYDWGSSMCGVMSRS